jgi:hypothetical protein
MGYMVLAVPGIKGGVFLQAYGTQLGVTEGAFPLVIGE